MNDEHHISLTMNGAFVNSFNNFDNKNSYHSVK